MFSLFRSSHHSLSPLARRGFRCLLPLCALAMVALAFAVGTSLFVRDPEQARLAAARASYEEARRTQASQQTARKAQEDLSALWQLLPARTEFPELVLTVSEVAREDHVVLSEHHVADAEQKDASSAREASRPIEFGMTVYYRPST